MALSVLNNVASLAAQNQLTITNGNLQKALFQLSSGSRINTGADDAAGLAIADGLHANITALTQSARNANDGVGELQVADGSLAAVAWPTWRMPSMAVAVRALPTPATLRSILRSRRPLGRARPACPHSRSPH